MRAAAVAVLAAIFISTAPVVGNAEADLTGRILLNGIGVPGATVSAARGERTVATVSGEDGTFRLADLEDGAWTLRVEMRGFVTETREIAVPAPAGDAIAITLTMQSFDAVVAAGAIAPPRSTAPVVAAGADEPDETAIINGSVINGGATPFAQPRAFGNNRPLQRARYSGAINLFGGSSALNAKPYSFTGDDAPAPSYGDLNAGFMLSGPMQIPWVVKNGPQTTIAYQHGINHNAITQSGLMPTEAERRGDFSASSITLRDPRTGVPLAGNAIPDELISDEARALLDYFPLPNAETTTGANYQRPVLTSTTEDRAQVSVQAPIGRRNSITGSFAFLRSAASTTTLFGFEDEFVRSTVDATASWTHRVNPRTSMRLRYQFTRAGATSTPFFAHRINVSGDAGIQGNNQDPENWGPPVIAFPDVADLRDALYDRTVNRAHSTGAELLSNHGKHNVTVGGDVRWIRFDVRSEQDPRGGMNFTGGLTGIAFADFLVGVPATASIASGNPDKQLRGMAYDLYVNDDWRIDAALTLNLGLRWEYESPFTEAAGRLINLEIAPDFSTATPVPAHLHSDWRGLQPRLGLSWRPISASPFVIRASYGRYRNTNVYQPLAMLLAQQPPFSKTYSVQNTPRTPLTIATAFTYQPPAASNTFAIDPNLRVGAAQNWMVSAQQEWAADLTATAAYLGTYGDDLIQAALPNTNPPGAIDPCPSCPTGFVYLTSGGSSLRHALQLTLRRRLRNGLTATLQYTFSKSTDDAATFNSAMTTSSLAIAQDWRDLGAERGPSSFDQPHLVTAQFQYTTGVGVTGGTLVDGFWGKLYKDWTITGQLTSGSGLPGSPVYFVTVPGTGVVGVRPSLTGAPLVSSAEDAYANPEAYAAPQPGTWGDAGRNSIRGPRQFAFDASLARTFRTAGRLNFEWRIDAYNVLNRVTFSTINRVTTSPQFGLPTTANAMRRLQMTVRVRF